MSVCLSVCRNNDQDCLRRLVFNIQDSDVNKFDDVICHNSTMDSPTRRALYSEIRRQIAQNFKLANKRSKREICRYCKMQIESLNEYVAFIYFTETAESGVDTSATHGKTVSPAAVDKMSDAGMDVVGKTGSKGDRSDKKVSEVAVDSRTEIKSECLDIQGEIEQCSKLEKSEEVVLHDSVDEESKPADVTLRPEAAQTLEGIEQLSNTDPGISDDQSGQTTKVIGDIVQLKTSTSKLLDVEPTVTTWSSDAVEQQADDDTGITEDQAGETGKVIGQTSQLKTGTKEKLRMLLSEFSDVEPDDEICSPNEPDVAETEQPYLMSEVEGAKQSTDEIVTGNLSGPSHEQKAKIEEQSYLTGDANAAELSGDHTITGNSSEHEAMTEVSSRVNDLADDSQVLYEWKPDTVLQPKADSSSDDVELRNVEFKKLSDFLCSRTDPTTTFHRFPTLYDLPVLAPLENPEWSVTWHLAEKFEPSNPTTVEPGLWAENQAQDADGKPASDVVFVGPYDLAVIKQWEVVRRRVGLICDEMLPQSISDILCVTDVGSDVSLTRLSDIFAPELLSSAQHTAYTAADPKSAHVSCVLLRFRPPNM